MQRIFSEDIESNRAHLTLLAERHNDSYYKKSEKGRKAFNKKFSYDNLKHLTLEQYVTGSGSADTFCYYVEVETSKLGSIGVRSAHNVYGVYYNKSQSKYVSIPKWNKRKDEHEAIKNIRDALCDLYLAGEKKEFDRIEKNKLSSFFKRKILSLYFPDSYIGAFSDHFVKKALDVCGIMHTANESFEELRSKLLSFQKNTSPFNEFRSQLFVDYLYRIYENELAAMDANEQSIVEVVYDDDWKLGDERQRPTITATGKSDYERQEKDKRALGKKAEDIVYSEECKKLAGTDYTPIHISKDNDGAGYDIESFELNGEPLHIEVKASRRDNVLDFYLTWNEKQKLEIDKAYIIYYICNVNTQRPKIRKVNAEMIRNGTINLQPDKYKVSYEIK